MVSFCEILSIFNSQKNKQTNGIISFPDRETKEKCLYFVIYKYSTVYQWKSFRFLRCAVQYLNIPKNEPLQIEFN